MTELTSASIAKPTWLSRYWIYAPLLICILIMLPRLLSPQFGLLDDPRSLTISQGIVHGHWDLSWDLNAGRVRPVYWAAFAFWYLLAGGHAFWYFFGNLLVFSITTFLLITLVKTMGGSYLQAFLTGLVFTLSTPIIENVYTLSKSENLQVLLLLCTIWLVFAALRFSRGLKYWLLLVVATLVVIATCFTKENTLIMLPISLVWWGLAFVGRWRRLPSAALVERVTRHLILTFLVGCGLFYAGRTLVLSRLLGVGYSSHFSFDLRQLLSGVVRWGGWMLRDYFWLLLLALVVLVICLVRRRWPRSGLWWLALIWMVFWLGLYIPWIFAIGYYLLPFAAGAAVFSGVMLVELVDLLHQPAPLWRGLGVAGLGLTSLLLLVTQANSYTDASIQLAQDISNARAMDYVAGNAPFGSQVVVNIQLANEYIEEMQLLLANYYGRPDLTLVNYQGQDLSQLASQSPPTYFMVAELANQPKLTVRMGLDEPSLQVWNASISPVLDTWHQDFQVSADPRILSVDFPRLLCSVIYRENYCSAGWSLVNYRQFHYQWSVYTP
jgi:hypothetical protein